MMKKTRGVAAIAACAALALNVAGCGGEKYSFKQEFIAKPIIEDGVSAYEGKITASDITSDGHLESDGVPLLMLGGQLRTDLIMKLEGKTAAEMDDYFALCARLNITIVQVPLCWADVETKKDVYENEYINEIMRLSAKHGLKLEFLWFGSYMCGVSVVSYVPQYVFDDQTAYPALNAFMYNGWVGKTYMLKPATDALLEREKKALAYAMKSVYEYDCNHGGKKIVVGIQIENEPDMAVDPNSDKYSENPDDVAISLVKHLDELGQVVKGSDYVCYTRVNLTVYSYLEYFTEKLIESKGIDFVGVDPYNNSVAAIKSRLTALDKGGNFAHIAENGGEYTNNDQLELLAFTMGCGYEVFEVVTTSSPLLADWELRGVFNTDFTKKSHTQRLIDANKIYKNGYVDLVLAGAGKVIGFNLAINGGADNSSETLSAGGITVSHKTTERGMAYAAVRGNIVTLASTKSDEFSLGKKVVYAEKGAYDAQGVWKCDERVKWSEKTKVEAGCVYRLMTE